MLKTALQAVLHRTGLPRVRRAFWSSHLRLGRTASLPGLSVTPLEMAAAEESEGRWPFVPEEERMQRVLSNLRASCSSRPDAPPVSHKFAAVLVPLFADASGEVHVVLTQRSSKLKTHSGEVCFPGGKRDAGEDDIRTALREAHEELGIDPASVSVVCCLPPFLSKHLLSVTPVLATIPPNLRFTPNKAEVEHVFTAPLRMFLEGGPHYRSRDVQWEPGIPYRLHYFDYTFQGRQFLIWGLTAGMLIVVAEKAYQRPPAFQPNPPGALPYTALSYDGTSLVLRGGRPAAAGDVQQLASAAAADESLPSAAQVGGLVTDAEAEAAVHEEAECGEQDEEEEARRLAAGLRRMRAMTQQQQQQPGSG